MEYLLGLRPCIAMAMRSLPHLILRRRHRLQQLLGYFIVLPWLLVVNPAVEVLVPVQNSRFWRVAASGDADLRIGSEQAAHALPSAYTTGRKSRRAAGIPGAS